MSSVLTLRQATTFQILDFELLVSLLLAIKMVYLLVMWLAVTNGNTLKWRRSKMSSTNDKCNRSPKRPREERTQKTNQNLPHALENLMVLSMAYWLDALKAM